jgi:hypothetical protein
MLVSLGQVGGHHQVPPARPDTHSLLQLAAPRPPFGRFLYAPVPGRLIMPRRWLANHALAAVFYGANHIVKAKAAGLITLELHAR